MLYLDFVNKLQASFKHIVFEKSELTENRYSDFYSFYNPKQVEFEYNGTDLLLLPYSKIEQITKEYAYLKSDFVFGLANSDPYFVKDGMVYTCYHGDENPDLEFIANSFDDFLKQILEVL